MRYTLHITISAGFIQNSKLKATPARAAKITGRAWSMAELRRQKTDGQPSRQAGFRSLTSREIPWLWQGDSRSLVVPAICLPLHPETARDNRHGAGGTRGLGPLQVPLRGPQPKSLRLCGRIVTRRRSGYPRKIDFTSPEDRAGVYGEE